MNVILTAALLASALFACSSNTVVSEPAPTDPALAAPPSAPPILEAPTPAVHDPLVAAGLDPTALPHLDALVASKNKPQIIAVMKSFAAALGTDCHGCHEPGDFAKKTPRMKVSAKMWSEYVEGLARSDGSAIYCDTCHQGKITFLDRDAGKEAIAAWMKTNFVGKLARRDGGAHSCGTCHGDPFEPDILDRWEK